ncbi:MAG: AraC family transcriptional regulator [Hyphomicrobiales bacterium]
MPYTVATSICTISIKGRDLLNWEEINIEIADNGKVRCEDGWRLTEEWYRGLEDCDLWLVRSGRGSIILDSGEIELEPGVCIWMRPGHTYLATQDPGNRLAVSYIHFTMATEHGPVWEHLPGELFHLDVAYADALMGRVIELSQQSTQPSLAASSLLKGLLIDLALRDTREKLVDLSSPYSQPIRRIMADIKEDPSRQWSLQSIRDGIHLSADHFTRVFKKETGMTPNGFVINCRIERAKKLLMHQRLSVGEVAHVLNYSSVFFFSRQFKSVTGVSPREMMRGKRDNH